MPRKPTCLYKGCDQQATTERTITLGDRIDALTYIAPEAQLHTLMLCATHAELIDAFERSRKR